MSNWKKNITIEVLGLERDLWDKLDEPEQKTYINAILHYAGFVICAFLGAYTLLYLISSSYLLALIAGTILGLILSSIVRFSLIILRKSIFDVSKSVKRKQVNPLLNNGKQGDKFVAIKPTNTLITTNNSTPIQPTQTTSTTSNRVSTFFKKLSFLKFPTWGGFKITSDSTIPGFAMLIRVVILTNLGLLIVLPLTCLLHFSRVADLNTAKREELKQRFILDARKSLEKKANLFNSNIEEIKTQISKNIGVYQVNGLMKQKQQELAKLNKDLNGFNIENEEDYQKQLKLFNDQIEGKYFLISTFYDAVKFPFFIIVLSGVFYLLFTSHKMLFNIKKSKLFIYPKESTKLYKQIIEKEYNETQAYLKKYLLDKYQYDATPFMENSFWLNPPYCTEKRKFFKKRTAINKQAFLDHFNAPKIPMTIEN